MRVIITASIVLAALPSIHAISLADFQPYLTNLPTACQTIYSSQVPGCQASDFTSGHGCGSSCILGLRALVAPVQLACSNANVFSSTNVLNTFITGDGVKSLCPNAAAAEVVASTPSTTSTTSTPSPTSTDTPTTAAASTTETPTPISTTSNTPTSESTTTAAIVATSSTTSSSVAGTTSSSSQQSSQRSASTSTTAAVSSSPIFIYSSSAATNAAATSTTSSQGSRPTNNSGGGSPFDTTSNTASGFTAGPACSFALFLSALFAAYIL